MRRSTTLALCASLFTTVPASAAENDRPSGMSFVQEWSGPFKETMIIKAADYSDGVVCYIYAPKSVSYNFTPQGIAYGNNTIGTISCVKVEDRGTAQRKK